MKRKSIKRRGGIRKWGLIADGAVLCFSDTHLVPADSWYADDCPDAIADLISRFPDHRVVILGDFIESLVVPRKQLDQLAAAPRLAALFEALGARDLRILVGNHDVFAEGPLRRFFGRQRVVRGPQLDGAITYAHGHENELDISPLARAVGRYAVPALVTLGRLGINPPMPNLRRRDARLGKRGTFLISGHTHRPAVGIRGANTGSFLRRGAKTFVTIEEHGVDLWQLSA